MIWPKSVLTLAIYHDNAYNTKLQSLTTSSKFGGVGKRRNFGFKFEQECLKDNRVCNSFILILGAYLVMWLISELRLSILAVSPRSFERTSNRAIKRDGVHLPVAAMNSKSVLKTYLYFTARSSYGLRI